MSNYIDKFFDGRICPSDFEKQFIYDFDAFKGFLKLEGVKTNPLKYLLMDYYDSEKDYEC